MSARASHEAANTSALTPRAFLFSQETQMAKHLIKGYITSTQYGLHGKPIVG